MDFEWTQEATDMRQAVTTELERIMEEPATEDSAVLTRRVHALLGKVGYWERACHPHLDLELLAVDLAVAQVSSSLYLSVASTKALAMLAARLGNGGELTAAIQGGAVIGAVGFSETDDSPCTAESEDEVGFLLRGNKTRVSNGPIADWLAVFANRGEFLGFVQLGDGVIADDAIETVGLDGLAVASVSFAQAICGSNRALVAAAALDACAAYQVARDVCLSVAAVGLMQRAIRSAKAYAQNKKRDGKPLIAHQLVRFALAEMLTMQQAGELMLCRAAWALSKGDAEATTLVRCAKVFCSESAEQVGIKAVEIAGAHGYARGNEIERAYRDAIGTAVLGTQNGVARIGIGDALLARYA